LGVKFVLNLYNCLALVVKERRSTVHYMVYFCCKYRVLFSVVFVFFIYVILLQIVVIYVYVIPVTPLSWICFYKFGCLRIISGWYAALHNFVDWTKSGWSKQTFVNLTGREKFSADTWLSWTLWNK